jgi:hypothetical protein
VDRGDVSSPDFDTLDFTIDDDWHVLDLSSILPKGNILFRFQLLIKVDAADSLIEFRKNGNANHINVANLGTHVADIIVDSNLHVMCDSNRLVEYRGTTATWETIQFVVLGWYP